MNRFSRSWDLMSRSFAILKSDKELMLLPVASAICCVLVSVVVAAVGFVGGGSAYLAFGHTRVATAGPAAHPLLWVAVFAFYLANYFVIVYFNVALISAATERLAGRQANLQTALANAWQRKGKIAQWALLAATVGILLKMMERRLGWIGVIVVRLIGIAWTLASYFVAPVLAFEDLGPVDALKRSARMFRETWGEEIVAQFSFGIIFGLLALGGIGLWVLLLVMAGTTGLIVGGVALVIWLLVLGVANSAMQGIFVAALYQYANSRTVPPGFVPENFSMAWAPKKKKFGL
jgi:hypothetical protein